MTEAERRLAIAVLDVVLSMSDQRRKQVMTGSEAGGTSVQVPRGRMRRLVEALEDAHPGALERALEASR